MRAMIAALVLGLTPGLLHAEGREPPVAAVQEIAAAEVAASGPDGPPEPAAAPDEHALAAAETAAALVDEAPAEAIQTVIEVRVSISRQIMEVRHHGELIHEWPVSTARKGKVTPRGSFRPQWLSKNHRSSLYDNAPMPYSIFYSGHYAIHGTDQESKLGRPASAGCVRLSRANAKILFAMVVEEGKDRMRVDIVD